MTWFDQGHLTGQGEKLDSKVSASPLAKDSAMHEKSYFQEKSHVRKPALQSPLLLREAGIWSRIRAVRSEVNPCFLPLQTTQSLRYTNCNPRASSYRALNGKSLEQSHHPDDPLKSTRIGQRRSPLGLCKSSCKPTFGFFLRGEFYKPKAFVLSLSTGLPLQESCKIRQFVKCRIRRKDCFLSSAL